MLQEYQSKLSTLVRMVDAVLITFVLWLCSFIYQGSWSNQITLVAVSTIAIYYFIAELVGLYRSWRGVPFNKYIVLILSVWIPLAVVLLLIGWATKTTAGYSRLAMGSWLLFTPFLLVVLRLVIFKCLMYLRKNGFNTRSIAIVGSGAMSEELIKLIEKTPAMGMDIKAVFDDLGAAKVQATDIQKPYACYPFAELVSKVRSDNIDVIYITLPLSEESEIQKIMDDLADTTAAIYLVPDFFAFNLMNMRWSSIGHIGAISLLESPLIGTSEWLKRFEDLLFASGILVIIMIPMLVIALSIKLTSKGPILFKQKRFGLDGKEIKVWKFRSMSVCEDGDQVIQATKNDSRITPVGSFLRKKSLDELPQFFNVLQGSMSVVGPRPHAVSHNEEYRVLIGGYMLRHMVKPGITGWAQINGWRGETDSLDKMEGRVEHDLWYIKHWSVWLDIKIIFLTVFRGFVDKNAY